MIKVITKSGFETEIPQNALNDMEVVDALAVNASGDDLERMKALSVICKKLFGKDRERIYDHVRTEEGRVPPELIEQEILDVFDALGEAGKN